MSDFKISGGVFVGNQLGDRPFSGPPSEGPGEGGFEPPPQAIPPGSPSLLVGDRSVTEIRHALMPLFDSIPSVRLLAVDAGIPLPSIDFSGDTEVVLNQVILEAHKHGEAVVAALIGVALKRYPTNAGLLKLVEGPAAEQRRHPRHGPGPG